MQSGHEDYTLSANTTWACWTGSECQSLLLTQRDLLSGVGRQQEDEECERGDEDAGDEEVESVVERPPPHDHGEGHVGVRLLTAVVETLAPPSRNLCTQTPSQVTGLGCSAGPRQQGPRRAVQH